MVASPLARAELLERVPQQRPFRFVDSIDDVTETSAVGSYRFRPDEYFYSGHFPSRPVTPGVILIETIAQTTVVPLSYYLTSLAGGAEASSKTTLFTEANVEFLEAVYPSDRVTVRSEKIYFRRNKLKVRSEMLKDDGTVVCSGELAGIGVEL